MYSESLKQQPEADVIVVSPPEPFVFPPRLSVVLVVKRGQAPTDAARILRQQFAHVEATRGAIIVGVTHHSVETVLDYCREHGVTVVASCVVSRTVVTP